MLNAPVIAMAAQANGYRFVAFDGGIFAYGDARFLGSMGGSRLNRPIVGMAASPSGNGYWLVASDGGIFAYGDATFAGSAVGAGINNAIGIAANTVNGGYYVTTSDGHIYNFGSAETYGDIFNISYVATGPLNRPIVGFSFS